MRGAYLRHMLGKLIIIGWGLNGLQGTKQPMRSRLRTGISARFRSASNVRLHRLVYGVLLKGARRFVGSVDLAELSMFVPGDAWVSRFLIN